MAILSEDTIDLSIIDTKTAEQLAESANTNATNAVNKVNNLQIGGRNLALTSQWLDSVFLSNTSGTNKCVEIATYSDRKSIKLTGENTVAAMAFYFKTPYKITLNNGVIVNCDMPADNYQYSFDIKNSDVKTLNSFQIRLFQNRTNAGVTLTTKNHIKVTTTGNESEWTRVNGSFDVEIRATASNTLTGTYDIYVGYVTLVGQALEVSLFKFERGSKATDWSPAPEDVQSNIDGVQNNLNNLEVGGVNLLRNTGSLKDWYINGSASNYTFDGSEVKIGHGSAISWGYFISMYPKIKYSFIKDKRVKVSLWLRTDSDFALTEGNVSFSLRRSPDDGKNATVTKFKNWTVLGVGKTVPSKWTRYTWAATVNDAFFDSGTDGEAEYIIAQVYNRTLTNLYVKDIQLEYGDKATAWSVSPDDTQAQIDNITKHVVIGEDSVDIVGSDGKLYASYGETAQIGDAASSHIELDSDGIDFYAKWSGSPRKVASFEYAQEGQFSGLRFNGGNEMDLYAEDSLILTCEGEGYINDMPFYEDLMASTPLDMRDLETTNTHIEFRAAKRCLNVVTLYLRVKGSVTIKSGESITGTIRYKDLTISNTYYTPEWLPSDQAAGVGYYGARALVANLTPDGVLGIRNTGSDLTLSDATKTATLTITYVI